MAVSIKIAGVKALEELRRRVIRQYNLFGTDGLPHRISTEDRDDLLAKIDDLIAKIEGMHEDSPDIKRESPF